MIPNSNQFRGNSTLKIHFFTFAWAFEWTSSDNILKSNSQGTGPRYLYLQNRYNSLNQIQFFEIKKLLAEKSYGDL